MTTTPNYDLELIANGSVGWGSKVNGNFTITDAQLKALADAISDEIEARALAVQEVVDSEVFSADWWPTGFSVLKSAGQQPVGRVAA